MTLDEVYREHPVVSASQARFEVLRHGLTWDELVAENGDKTEYDGWVVLGWLGY